MKLIVTSTLLFLSIIGFGQITSKKGISAFVENNGQILDQSGSVNESILFLHSNNKGINTQFHKKGISYDLFHSKESNGTTSYIFDRIDVEFLQISEKAEIIALDEIAGINNYYSLNTKSKQIGNVRQFASIIYRNIYPNIDVVFKTNKDNGSIKYDFILHPGASIQSIKLRYKGIKEASLENGELSILAGEKKFKESIPMSWYQEDGKEISIDFKILNTSESIVDIGFECKETFKANQTLVIDPVPELVWAKYIGDSLITTTKGVITDRFGYIYICGSTQSINNIATSGAYQTVLTDSISDAYISKYNKYGSLIWSTYFGGNLEDVANAIYVDTSFNVFIAGTTFSTVGLTDSTSFQDSLAGSSDAFLAKFNKLGQLQWSTYIGGDSTDVGLSLSTDYLQNVYLGGNTASLTGIATDSSFQTSLSGEMDGFLSKFDSTGTLLWSTYIGGQNVDLLSKVAFGDTAIHICGKTYSTDFPISGTNSQDSLVGLNDGFIARFDPNGNLIWSTYYGGDQEDEVNSIKVFNNNLYFTGTTNSDTNISTIGSFQPIRAGLKDAFVGKMFNDGSLSWGTYFGGDSTDSGVDLFFELDSNIFIIGSTNSLNLPIIQTDPYQAQFGGMQDVFLSKFTNLGQNLWCTYYGGPAIDNPEAVAVYGNTGIYIVGSTFSDTAIVPTFQQWATNTFNSSQEGFFTRFVQGKSTCAGGICSGGGPGGQGGGDGSFNEPSNLVIHCPGTIQMLTVQGGDLATDADWIWYEGTCGNGPTVGAGDTIYVSPTQTTTYFVRAESITNATECVHVTVYVTTIVPISILSDTTVCIGSDFTLEASGVGTYNWSGPNGFTHTEADTTFTVSDSTYQGWYYLDYADTNGCEQKDSLYLHVYPIPTFSAAVNPISCFSYNNGSIVITTSETYDYAWNVPVTNSMALCNLTPGTYILTTTNLYNCERTDTFQLIEPSSILLDTLVLPTTCADSNGMIILYLEPNSGPYSILWNPSGWINDTITNLTYGNYSVEIELPNTCVETHTFLIPNQNELSVSITDFGNVNCLGESNGYAVAEGAGGIPAYTYAWSPTGQTSESITNLDTGTYIVTVYDQDGCFAFDTVTIGLNSTLQVDSLITPSLCSVSNGAIQLIVSDPSSISSINWSTGLGNSLSLTQITGGNYSVQLIDSFGCLYKYDFYIPIINDLEIEILPGDTLIDYGSPLDLTVTTNYTGIFDYIWNPNTMLSCSNCQTTTTYTTNDQTYQVIVNDQNGCIDTAYITILVGQPCIELYIPTIFSPNGDELNDSWKIIGTCLHSIHSKVFNQWGEVIFESSDQTNTWDGTYKESKVPNDNYSFVISIEFENGTKVTRSGSVRVMY